MMRSRFGWILWLTTLSAWPARATTPCEELQTALKPESAWPAEATQLRAFRDGFRKLVAACESSVKESTQDHRPLHRGRTALARIEARLAEAMNATRAAPEAAATRPTQKNGREANPPTPATASASNQGGPRKDALQARRAIDSAKQAWRPLRDELKAVPDEATRKTTTPLYVAAAMTYLEALVRWGEPQQRDYAEVMAPLIGDDQAQAALQIASSGSKIRKLLLDPKKAAALRRYIDTSVKLGQVAPERSKALGDLVAANFSDATLDELVRVWGQQYAEQLVRELDALASVGERMDAAAAAQKQMLLMVVAPRASGAACVGAFSTRLEEDLGTLYGDRLHIVRTTHDGAFDDARLQQELERVERSKVCLRCDAAVAVVVRQSSNDMLDVEGRFLVLGGVKAKLPPSRRSVSCGDPTSPVLAAGALFKALLEQAPVRHSQAPIFNAAGIPVVVAATDPTENVRFACGSFQRRLPEAARKQAIAIKNQCSLDTAQALAGVLNAAGRPAALREPAGGEPTLELRRLAAEAGSVVPARCEASLRFEGEQHLHSWAQVIESKAPDESDLDRLRNAKTGDRLALCLLSYDEFTRAPAVPPARPEVPSRPPPWVPALLAPGLPLLQDDNPRNDWLGYTWMGGDALALASTVGFAFLSIDRRNSAASSSDRDLATADTYLTASVISGAVFLASHLTSTLVFGFRDPERARARRTPPNTVVVW